MKSFLRSTTSDLSFWMASRSSSSCSHSVSKFKCLPMTSIKYLDRPLPTHRTHRSLSPLLASCEPTKNAILARAVFARHENGVLYQIHANGTFARGRGVELGNRVVGECIVCEGVVENRCSIVASFDHSVFSRDEAGMKNGTAEAGRFIST